MEVNSSKCKEKYGGQPVRAVKYIIINIHLDYIKYSIVL